MGKVKLPLVIVNFKTYPECTGKKALELAKVCGKVASETKAEILIAVQAADIRMIANEVNIKVLAQHIDPYEQGTRTGWISPESVKEAGAVGTLLNHSERAIDAARIISSIKKCRELGLTTIVCADVPDRAEAIAYDNPDFIAIEPPELIAGNVSVSKAKPEVITESVKKVESIRKIPVLCGAGVKDKEDVKKALKLGASGILVASGIVKAKNPEEALRDLVEGLG